MLALMVILLCLQYTISELDSATSYNLENLSKNKPTNQSSTFDTFKSLPASLAVDGRTDGTVPSKDVTCAHTNIESKPWWSVDLGQEALVHYVRIYLRTDCCSSRYSNVSIYTQLEHHRPWRLCKHLGALYQKKMLVAKCREGRRNATGVKVVLYDRQALTLCEVEVFGLYVDHKKASTFRIKSKPYASAYIGESVGAMSRIGRMFAISDSNLTYFIVNGTDEVDFQVWVNKINGCLPEVYRNYREPRNFFCIDYKTGELFTTSLFVKKRPWAATDYYLKLRADNKIRYYDQTFVLKTRAQCKKLVRYYTEQIVTNNDCLANTTLRLKYLTFNSSLGDEDRLKEGSLVALDIDVSAPMAILNKTHLTNKPIYLSADIVEGDKVQRITIKHHPHSGPVHHIYLTEPFVFRDSIYPIKLRFYDEDRQFYSEIDVTDPEQKLATFYYVLKYDYCSLNRLTTCKDDTEHYMRLKSKMAECHHFDAYMMEYKFGYCTAPSFERNPRASTLKSGTFSNPPLRITKKMNEPITIPGCYFVYNGRLTQDVVYWLKDSSKKIKTTFQISKRKSKQVAPSKEYRMDDIVIAKGNYTHQGYYECVIEIPGKYPQVSQQRVDVQFEDMSHTRLMVKTNNSWDYRMLEGSSSKVYRDFEKEIINHVSQALIVRGLPYNTNTKIKATRFFETLGKTRAVVDVMLLGVTPEQRLTACDSFGDSLKLYSYDIRLTYLDCCPAKTFGENAFKGRYTFDRGIVSKNYTKPCLYDTTKSLTWRCYGNLKYRPYWDIGTLENCLPKSLTTYKLLLLDKVVICSDTVTTGCQTAEEVLEKLNDIIKDGSVITTYHDVQLINKILKKIEKVQRESSPNLTRTERIMKNVVAISSKILDSAVDIFTDFISHATPGPNMLENLESFAELIGSLLTNETTILEIDSPNIALSVASIDEDQYFGIHSVKDKKGKLDITASVEEEGTWTNETYGWIKVPREAVPDKSSSVSLFVFRKSKMFFPEKSKIVQSTVLNVKLGNMKIENLTNPIVLKFRKIFHADIYGKSYCAFWDYEKQSELPNVKGAWSTRGCESKDDPVDSTVVLCFCDHMTNFALLVDVEQMAYNPVALSIVTYIGCAVSICGITMTLIFYVVFKNLRTPLPSKIHINLCISLLLLLLLFISGGETTEPRIMCQVISALLFYFQLTSFFWMFVEAFNLYRYFVMVFKNDSDTSFLVKAMIIGWGVPVLIVVTCATVRPDELGNDKVCVVRGDPFFYGLLLPICLILAINFFILLRVFHGIKSAKVTRIGKNPVKNILSQSRVLFAFSILIGFTWIFGLLAFGSAAPLFQWMFCIFNSLQGFYIFIFYTALNGEAQKEIKSLFCCVEKFQFFSSKAETEELQLYRWQISELLYNHEPYNRSITPNPTASARTSASEYDGPETLI